MNDRGAAMGRVFVVQAVFLGFFFLEIRNASKVDSVPATESCFIYSAVPYIISRNTEGSCLSYFSRGEKVGQQAEK